MAMSLRLLLVEDSVDDADLIVRDLKRAGFEVDYRRVQTAQEMTQALNEGPWQAVISDYVMPTFSGMDALALLKDRGLDLPFIIVSGAIGEETAVAALKAGAHDYMVKGKLAMLPAALDRELREAQERARRRQAEKALLESERRFHAMFNQTFQFNALLQPDGRIVEINQSALDFLELSAEQASGKLPGELPPIPYQVSEEMLLRLRGALEQAACGDFCRFDLDLLDSAGQPAHAIDLSIKGVTDARGGITMVLVEGRDMTESRRLQQHVLEISRREQRRIGQDLHDMLGQNLTGLAFLVKVLERKLNEKNMPEAADAAALAKLANQAINQSRALARGLLPVELTADGLMTALEGLAANIETLFGIPCHFHCDQPVLLSDDSTAVHLYNIAREAAHNAVKHAHCRNIRIELKSDSGQMVMQVCDDGIGLQPGGGDGMGLHIMRYRARMIGAELSIKPNAGAGTAVVCTLRPRHERAGYGR